MRFSTSSFWAFAWWYLPNPLIVRTGSWTALNSKVPTAVDGNKGVNKKWFAGLTCVEQRRVDGVGRTNFDSHTGADDAHVELALVQVSRHFIAAPAAAEHDDARFSRCGL